MLAAWLMICSLAGMWMLSGKGKMWLSPWNGYLFSHVFLLGVAFLKLDPTMVDFQSSTWFAIVTSAGGFMVGCALVSKAMQRPEIWKPSPEAEKQVFVALMKGALPLLFVCFLIGVYISYRSSGGWPIFMHEPGKAREKFAWPGFVGVMFFQSVYCLAIAGMVVKRYSETRLWRAAGLAAIVVTITVGALSGMRFYSVLCGLTWLLFEDVHKPIKLRKLLILGIFALAALIVVFLLRMGALNWQVISFSLKHLEYTSTFYMPIYLYVANNFWNLDWMFYLQNSGAVLGTSFGYNSFWGFFYPSHLTFSIDKAFAFDDRFAMLLRIRSLNTVSYQGLLYVDFGWIGLFLIPLLVGALSSWAFWRTKSSGSVPATALYAVLGFGVVFSFFAWLPRQPSFVLGLLLVAFAGLAAKSFARKIARPIEIPKESDRNGR